MGTFQTNKRKQKKRQNTTAKRQLKISTPQNSNTSTAKTKDTGNNELPAATAPSRNHNNESPATAERKSPIAASDKAKSSKGNLQQQNEKLRRNLQKAIQAAKDARAQRQKLAQEVKEVKSINSNLQQKLEENTKEINKLKLTNGTLASTNEALEAKLELMTKQLTIRQTRSAAPIEGERHEAPHQLAIEPTNRLDVMNDDGRKEPCLMIPLLFPLKQRSSTWRKWLETMTADIDETIVVNIRNDTATEDMRTNEKLETLQKQLVELQDKLMEQEQNAAKTKMGLENCRSEKNN